MRLYGPLSREINGERINTSFDTVLLVYEALTAPYMVENMKIETAYRLLAAEPREIPLNEMATFVTAALDLIVENDSSADSGERVIDFNQDANAIYASFLQAYGIDLIEERGRLDWRKFVALLAGLPEQTQMAQIIKIRTAEIPPINKHNRNEVQALTAAKARVRIKKTETEKEDALNAGLLRMFNTLKGMAKNV